MYVKLRGITWSKKHVEEPDIAIFKNIMVPRFISYRYLGCSKQ